MKKSPFAHGKSTAHSQRLALESRLVFDGALVATATEVQADSVDNKPVSDTPSAAAPSVPPVDFFSDKTPVATVDYQPAADSKDTQPAFAVEPTQTASPISGVSGDYATTLIVVDPRADNAAALYSNPPVNTQVIVLDAVRDGFQQVSELLQGRHDVTELNVLPWTNGNAQWLGNKALTATLDSTVSNELMHWGDGLTDNADIIFHGSTNLGASWLSHIDALTGADTHWVQGMDFSSAPSRELIVVDTSIDNYQSLLTAFNASAEILYIDPSKDGIQQIADSLKGRTDISALHILSHGSQGSFTLGSSTLSSDNIDSYQAQLADIGQSLSNNGDILFYGCEIAEGAAGAAFINQLANLTHADIAASNDVTGNAAKGGDWILEYHSGAIETVSSVASGYDGLLAAPTNNVPAAQSVVEDNPLTFAGAGNISISDGDGTVSTVTVSVANGTLTLSGTTGLTLTGNGTATINITGGTIAAINTALNGLIYNPTANYSGADTLTITTSDGTPITNTVSITVTPNATAPVLTLPNTVQIVQEDVSAYLNFTATNPIILTDADANDQQTLILSVAHGTLLIKTNVAGGITTASNNGTGAVTLTGTAAQLSATLADAQGIQYTSALNYNSSDPAFIATPETLSFSLSDGVPAHNKSGTVGINVTPVNDAPTFTGATPALAVEGGNVAFTRAQLAVSDNALDVDIQTGQQVILQLAIKIDSLPVGGTLTYKGGAVAIGSVVPVTDLANLVFTHDGTDIISNQTISFNVTVSDGGGGSTAGSMSVTVQPKNVAPSISGAPTLIEGQVKVVAPTINLGDTADTLATSTITIDNIITGGQGSFFIDVNNNNVIDAGETLSGTTTLDAIQRANLSTQLKFSQNGNEPNIPATISPSYRITVTDAGGATGIPSAAIAQTITLTVQPNNDDPTLLNTHASAGTALTAQEGNVTAITAAMLRISDADLDPANLAQTTPENQLVYTVGTRPTQGEIQIFVGGGLGYGLDGWITLGDGGRFTQAQVTADQVRYYQTTNVPDVVTTTDNFTFTVRDSAYGYDVWTDPANPTGNREGGLRATPTGAIATQQFFLGITPLAASNTPRTDIDGTGDYEGVPRPATPAFGGSNMVYSFFPTGGMLSNNSIAAGAWDEANVNTSGAGNVITNTMLSYTITRTDTRGTLSDPADDISITVPPNETVYTLTAQPSNGIIQSFASGSWQNVHTNAQFTQADINSGNIRFVHDGGEDHITSFGYTVSDGTPNNYPSTFGLDITPTNDRPAGLGGTVTVNEKLLPTNDGLVRLGSSALGMSDVDLSQDVAKQVTPEGKQDFLWFKVIAQPADTGATQRGELQRWNGSAWVTVTPGEWLPSTLLTTTADGATSGLRYAHDGSEPLAYPTNPNVTFQYQVRDDLLNPNNPFATDTSLVADTSGSVQSNQSDNATTTIQIIPVNNAPMIADKPGDADPTISGTIAGGGVLTGVNEILTNVPEGGTVTITSAFLTAIDRDNTTVQRQYILTSLPTQGNLLLNNQFLGAFSTFTQDDIDNNRLTYRHNGSEFPTPITDALGTYSDKFHFIVSDAVFSDFGANAPNYNTFLIDFGAVPTNDAPTIVGPSGIVEIDSATPANNLVTGFVIADPDLANGVQAGETDFVQVTVRLLDSAGTPLTNYITGFAGAGVTIGYTAQSGGLWAVTQTGIDSILQLQGSRDQVNAALAGLSVTFTNDANSMYKVQVIVDDRLRDGAGVLNATGNDANGGELNQPVMLGGTPTAVPSTVYDWSTTVAVPAVPNGNIAAATVDIRASRVNETPTFTGPATVTVLEDVRTLIPANSFVIADPESAGFNTPVTVTLSIPAGQGTLDVAGAGSTQTSFTPSGGQAITISGDGTNSITLTGRAADIQALLNQRNFANDTNDTNGGLYYSAPADGNHDYNAASTGDVTLTLSLNDTGSGFGSDVGAGSVPANPANMIIPITITPVNDAPTVTNASSAVPVAISGSTAVTGFVIGDPDNTDGGVLNATTGEVDFVQATIRLLPAAGTAPLPANGDAGGIDHSNVVFSSSTVGSATVDATYTGTGSALVIRGTMAEVNTYLSGLTVALSNGLTNNNATYRVEVIADDRLRNVVTGVLDVSNAANGGLNSDGFTGTANAPVTFVDPYAAVPVGLTLNVASNTRTILSSGVNEAPSFALLDNTPTFVENGAAIVLDANATLTDPELSVYSNWNQAVLTLARNGGANSDDIFGVTGSGSTGINFSGANIRNGATVIGTFTNSAGTLAITFNSSATNADVNLVLQAITYSNTNNTPPANITINYTINDSNTNTDLTPQGGANPTLALSGAGSIIVGITAVNDTPTLSGLTAKSYAEDATPVVIGTGLALDDPELKTFGAGDWGNAYLVLSRSGGADVNDVFSASGTLSALTEGSTLLDGAVTIGTVTQNTAGTLIITFADGVTTAQAQAALSKIAYSNPIQSLAAAATSPITLNWVLHDGDTDSPDRPTNGQGTTGDKSVTLAQTITLTGVNDAPVLADTALSITQTEDAAVPSGAVGTLVSALAGANITDADPTNPKGIAITATDSTNGTWYYSTNNGINWATLTATNTTALLLAADANTRVYFRPTANWQGIIASGLTIRAWDSSTGTNGGTAIQDLSIGANVGGTTAFSSATDVVAVTVTSVNDQPTATTDVVLPAILEDTTPNGALISGLAFGYSDTTDDQSGNGGGNTSTPFSYLAIVGSTNYIATQGSWQVSTTATPNPAVAGDWITIPVGGLSTSAALIFASDRQIRFVPAADFHGTPGTLQVRLADNNTDLTGTGKTSPNATTTFNLATPANGGTGATDAWNAVDRNISTTVTTVNDAPTLSGNTTFTATNEDTTSTTRTAANIAASLTYSDTTDNKFAITGGGTTESSQTALAIVGNAATAAQGTWQYTTDGSTWITVPAGISDSTAVVLNLANANHQIRFVPFANYNGAVGSLTLRAADGTWNTLTGIQDISGITGTTNPWSTGTATLGIAVNPVNDAPSITAPTIPTPTYIEQAAPLTIGTGVTVTDLIDDTQLFGATVTIGATNFRFGDTLAATVGATGITANYNDTTGTLTLSGVANIADYNTVLQSVTFSNLNNDAPTTTGATTRIITWQATDNNADNAANGRLPSNAVTSSINFTPVSDAPMGKNAIITTNEEQSYTFTTANFGFSDSRDNGPTNTLARVLISTLPANGTLQLNGVNVAAGDYINASDISSGKLTFVPATNFNSVTATTVNPALAITDNATITSTLTISGATGNISDLDVALNISHMGTGDLIITLTAPDGTVQTLFANSGDYYNDLVLTFDDEAATSVTAIPNDTNNNIPDSYRPANPLSVFDGKNPNGIWTLTVTDNTTGRTGTLNSWGLIQNTTTTPALNFTFRVEDTGSLDNGGVILDQSPNTMTINVIPLNDAPVLTATASNPSVTENATTASGTSVDPVALFTVASIADIDLSTTPTLNSTLFGAGSITVSFTDAYVTGDVLFVNAVLPTGVTVSGGTANSLTITLATTTTVAEVNNILAAISYKSTSDTPTLNDTDNSRDYQIVINDGNNSQGAVNPNAGGPTALNSNIINGTLTIASTNDAPIFTALGNTVSFTEVGSAVVLNNAVTISDVDLNPLNSGTGNYNGTTLTLARNGGANAEDVFSNSGTLAALTQGGNLTVGATIIGTVTTNSAGTLVLTFNTSATSTLVNSALQQIAYRNNSATPQDSVQINWLFDDQNPNITGGGINTGTGQDQGGGGVLTASGSTTITIDRLPTANADTNSIAENALNVTGNVITGATTTDDQGDPAAMVTGVATGTQPSTSGSVNTPIAGSYGSLTLDNTGGYTYTLDNANPLVNKLLTGQTLTETYSYTITDADGDTSTTTLTITINGVTDGAPTVVPVDGNGGLTGEAEVYEKGLVAPTDNTQTTTGTLTVTAPDGMASVTIGGTTFTVAQLATFSVGSPSVAINTGEGTLRVTGFNIGTGAVSAPTAGTLSYTYTLNATQAHTGGAAVTESVDTIALVVTDATTAANTSTGTLTVRIVDDTPTANPDTNSITENTATTTGNVFGAGSGGDVADRIGADVNAAPVTGVAAGTQLSTSGSVNTPVAGSYGSLTLNATGGYTYTLDNSNAAVNALRTGQTLTDTYSYTITDADGDTSTTTLTITINGATDGAPVITPVDGNGVATGEATVFEKGLVAPTDNSQTTTGTLTVTVPDGMASVTIGGTTFTVAQLATFSVSSPSAGINTGEGTLNVTGFTVTTGTASAPTSGTLSYSYTLNANQAHTGGAAVTESVDTIALIVTDATTAATQATGTLTVRIVDDTPTANADTNIVTEGTTAAATTTSGNVFSGSAPDVADRLGADVTATPVTGVASGTQASTSGNVGSAVAGSYGSLTLNADGSYTYTLDNTNPTVNALLAGNTLLETYSYTITDSDGDTSTTTLKITINGTTDNIPSIVPDDGNGAITGQLTVQESGLTSGVDTSETNTGTLTLSALDGLQGIKVASTPITLAELNNLGTTPVTITTPKGTITLTGYTSTADVGGVSTAGTLNYSYTLVQVQNTPAATENTDDIPLSITNAGGNTVNNTLSVQIVDDTPTANPDVNSVNEGNSTAATTTSGNVFSGGAPDVADRIGADVTATPVTAFSFGATNGTLSSPLNGSYGNLTLNTDGSYTYELDNTNPAVNALLTGETLLETYSYTITDADGDTSTTTLTITINGLTDSLPEITPIDGNNTETGEATVFEKGLVAPGDGSQTTTGTISVAAPDGMASVTIGGKTFTVAELATFSVGSPSASINTGEGSLIVTGFNIVAGPAIAPTAGTLSYSYTLNAAQPHTGGSAVTESTDRITLVITDNSSAGNTATSTLTVRIVDDAPTAKADTNSVIEGTTPAATSTQGNVFGTIGASAGDVADRMGADTTLTPVTGVSFAGSIKTVGTPFNSAYGSLTLNANGSYIYTLDNTNAAVNALGLGQTLSETFSYTITDADGDTSTTTLTITINGRNDAPIAVNDIQMGITGQAVTINVLGNDPDPENNINPATVKIVGTVNAGDSLEVAGQGIWSVNRLTGAITFTPFTGFTADPTPISYTVTDRTGLTSNPATVTVDYPQTPPLAIDNTVTGVTGRPVTITVLDNDSDLENDINPATLHIVGTTNAGDSLVVAGQGTWSVDVTTRTITFTPELGFTGSPTPISYTVSDNTGFMSNAARVTVNYPTVIAFDTGTSGSLIMLSNPDKTDSSSKYNEEEKKATLESKFKPDNQLPPARLSLYIPIGHYVISLTGSLRDQVVLELERYSFSIPRWMFRHTDPNEQLEFEAARPDGSSLPEWLTFNPKTLKFSGVPPKGAHNERVMVTARDSYGNEVHATFNVHVNKERMRSGVHHKVFEKHKLGEKRAVGKAGLSEQIHAMGKLSKLQESRALLDSFKSVVSLADKL